ncbi:MAG: ATP-binding cassette domain-containing protein [Bacilli bacterium]|nr:ATP-binding cassette domain-containing protein [Bacilli bacterium]
MEIVFDRVTYVIDKKTPLEKTILNDVSFSIIDSGIYSFIGASNSGKTAIADLINALIEPTAGSVKLGNFSNNGRKIRSINKLRSETGYVFKNPYDMFINKTVSKEIEYAMKHFKYKTKKPSLRINDALKLVGLDESYLDKNPLDLNLVDAKKVALASTLVYNPNIIILDEYTNGLSNEDKNDLIRLLRVLKNKYKKIILLLSKDTSFCYKITDKVFIMSLTRLVCEGDRKLLEDERLLKDNNLEVPKIVSFVNACNKKGHEIDYYNNILDLIKGVYRDVF